MLGQSIARVLIISCCSTLALTLGCGPSGSSSGGGIFVPPGATVGDDTTGGDGGTTTLADGAIVPTGDATQTDAPGPDSDPDPGVPCATSLDCVDAPGEPICEPTAGVCVGCVESADCDGNAVCSLNMCVPLCDSDIDCVAFGLLCNKDSGMCVECIDHAACAASEHCVAGACVPDLCTPGSTTCAGSAEVATCDDIGMAYGSLTPCGAGTVCIQAGSAASCQETICSPGASTCGSDDIASTCNDDGTAIAGTEDCSVYRDGCEDGECMGPLCMPGQADDPCAESSHCADVGCPAGLFCDEVSGDCYLDECAACVAPVPHCLVLGGETYCVECTESSECGAGQYCDEGTYTCAGDIPPGGCETDNDCDAAGTGFVLECDQTTGLCYDASGACDDAVAFCKGGAVCQDMSSLPIPGLPNSCLCDMLDCAEDSDTCPCPGLCNDTLSGILGIPPICGGGFGL